MGLKYNWLISILNVDYILLVYSFFIYCSSIQATDNDAVSELIRFLSIFSKCINILMAVSLFISTKTVTRTI
jgi:hypothetical protein